MERIRKRKPRTPMGEAAPYLAQRTATARRSLAVRRLYPSAAVRWKWIKTADGERIVMLVVLQDGRPPELAAMPAIQLAELAEQASNADAHAELLRHGRVAAGKRLAQAPRPAWRW